jgi:hypothetical protein
VQLATTVTANQGEPPNVQNDTVDVQPDSAPEPFNTRDEVVRAAIGTVPVAGSVVSAGEAITGQTIFGRELSGEERVILGGSAVLGSLGPIARGAVAGAIRELAPEASVASKIVEGAGDLASTPAVQAAENAANINFEATRGFNAAAGEDPETTLERAAASGAVSAVGGGAGEIVGTGNQLATRAIEAGTGAAGNVVDQAIDPDGFRPPDVTTPEGRRQLGTEIVAGGVTNIIGGATGDAVKETVGQVADSIPVGQLAGNEAAGQVAGSAAEGTVAFFGNTVTNAVENAVSDTPPQATPDLNASPVPTETIAAGDSSQVSIPVDDLADSATQRLETVAP